MRPVFFSKIAKSITILFLVWGFASELIKKKEPFLEKLKQGH
jgi:hypothetical protein